MAKWGIIGSGVIADTRFAPDLEQAKDSTLVAVHHRDVAKAEAFAEKHGALRAYASERELCQDPQVEAVYVASPNHLHAEHTVLATSCRKHVLCEKPMALSAEECQKMIQASEEAGVILGVAYMMPFHGSHLLMKKLLGDGLLGSLSLVKSDYLISLPFLQRTSFTTNQFRLKKAAGGGAIMDLGVHCLNTIRFLMGSEITKVTSLHGALRFNVDADDTALLLTRYDNGVLGVITLCFATEWGRNGIESYGEKGALLSEQSLSQVPTATVRCYVGGEWTAYKVEALDPYVGEIEHFTECMRTGQQPITSGATGLADMRIVEAARRSMERGTHVDVPRSSRDREQDANSISGGRNP